MENLMSKLLNFYNKPRNKSIINYLFFGVCTTLVNLVSYYLLSKIGVERLPANFISISVSILFAYFVNARYVFNSTVRGFRKVFKELSKFFTSRLFTMAVEILGVEVLVWIGIADFTSKLITQFIVIVANYLISKFLVFK
ncbi:MULTISPECIES: GtrA family protein [unclassified Gemella]|uniref:GtrA family protein n=1 Tax=unclassified Gemella TaxID=2624949 RepID=UPI00107363C9|nr:MULTISPECIES: GtrA family protein [unclassified Gemella]MBF0709700.1 GtrA family protein [Gemella sp. GL1.1]MBF0746882.1 GtrA family protein [Gemella sp. 19428wG2_WT2a]NYS27044.1 GtrA family protein [Gemella sp. GL1]TFU59112.1 GtrA family protein [Gemella sp. WT2a]